MKTTPTRSAYPDVYGPLAAKTLRAVLKRELMEQFGFETMGLIADALINRLLEILTDYTPEQIRLLPGQVLWLAVAKDEKCGYGKQMARCKLVPVRLTVLASEDLRQMAEERRALKELNMERAARLLQEAAKQGGVLALTDVEVLLGLGYGQGARLVAAYHAAHPDVVLPYRGTLQDMGRTCTHKLKVIDLKLRGRLTEEIAREIHHDPANVDRYQADFERVYNLRQDGKNLNEICFICQLSPSLVDEYLNLIAKHIEQGAPSTSPSDAGAGGIIDVACAEDRATVGTDPSADAGVVPGDRDGHPIPASFSNTTPKQ